MESRTGFIIHEKEVVNSFNRKLKTIVLNRNAPTRVEMGRMEHQLVKLPYTTVS